MNKTVNDLKIRLAVAGCGRISNSHFAAIEKHADEIELVAVCDTDPHTLKQREQQHSVPGFDRWILGFDSVLWKSLSFEMSLKSMLSGALH